MCGFEEFLNCITFLGVLPIPFSLKFLVGILVGDRAWVNVDGIFGMIHVGFCLDVPKPGLHSRHLPVWRLGTRSGYDRGRGSGH